MNPELAAIMPDVATAIVAGVFAALVAGVGFLIRRDLGHVDAKLIGLDTKLDTFEKRYGDQGIAIAELRLRVEHIESDHRDAKVWRRDIGGFLQKHGFEERPPLEELVK